LYYSVRDEGLAAVVRQRLAEAGLSVFAVSGLKFTEGEKPAAEFADEVRNALAESSALVALLTRAHRDSPALGVEIGAAWVQRKPVYVLVEGDGSAAVPTHVRRFQVYPLSELGSVIPAIAKTAQPLVKAGRKR
jgi:hypothetical protein